MRIEKIELNGFKSFADKTTFNLHPGVTCVVGPNGSGKSNVVDSFRWVLGEQSAKSLRSEKMEEVIFNGSATKKQKGMSEVNLTVSFDTPEQGGSSSSPTSISRRLYRSGESEYYINKTQCRLKDIRDILLDTGLEVRSYSILAQGQISEILNAKPLDRRFLIEEVAGVMKYKVRRAEAMSKLESSRANLQRVNDIISEVKKQINALDRQVKKAERYKRLSAEMGEIELKLAKKNYSGLREAMDKLTVESNAAKERETLLRADINRIENDVETGRIGLLGKEKQLEALNSELQLIEKELSEKERNIAVSTTEAGNLREYLGKLSQQESDLSQRMTATENRSLELEKVSAELRAESDRLSRELTQRKEALTGIESALSEKEGIIETKRKEIFRAAEDVSHLKNEISKFLASIENLDRKNTTDLREAEAARERLSGLETTINDTDTALINRNNELLMLNDKKGIVNSEIEEHSARVNEIRSNLAYAREELASTSSRLESLTEIAQEDSSKELLSERDRFRILASVAEIIEVDETYEKAIESALAEKVNGFLLPTFEDVTNAIAALRQKKISRTVFVPVNLSSRLESEIPGLNTDNGAGSVRASELLRVQSGKEAFVSVVRSLLNNIFVVKDLSAAAELLPLPRGAAFVTMEGEFVESTGAVIIGESKGILKRKREIRELTSATEQKKTAIEQLEKTLKDMDAVVQENKTLLKDMEASIIRIEKEASLLRLTADNQVEEKERVSRNLAYLHIELQDIAREKESLKNIIAENETKIAVIDGKKSEAEQHISDMQAAMAKNRELYETENTAITEIRLSLNSFKERMESARKEMDHSRESFADLLRTRTLLLEEKENIDSRILQCSEDTARGNEELKGLVLKADNLKTFIATNREIFRKESEDLLNLEQGARRLRSDLDSLTAKTAETDVAITEHRMRLETLSEGVRQNYGLDLDSFIAEPVAPEDEPRLSELKTKIQELGPVNLGSLEEYEELKTRYDFLSQQQDDLNRSMAELEEAITKINSTTRKKLREAFEQLTLKFSEVFTYLFGGGRASLVLTDENNILDSGIDIIAQPPGKKLQNINLLSGGEKTLTALSVLFASFLLKPSPLCVMDEVDAALDDSNIERFSGMLRDLAKDIQFIVVTHNRITMEAADYIYGITTEEPGVSKVISMQLSGRQETAGALAENLA